MPPSARQSERTDRKLKPQRLTVINTTQRKLLEGVPLWRRVSDTVVCVPLKGSPSLGPPGVLMVRRVRSGLGSRRPERLTRRAGGLTTRLDHEQRPFNPHSPSLGERWVLCLLDAISSSRPPHPKRPVFLLWTDCFKESLRAHTGEAAVRCQTGLQDPLRLEAPHNPRSLPMGCSPLRSTRATAAGATCCTHSPPVSPVMVLPCSLVPQQPAIQLSLWEAPLSFSSLLGPLQGVPYGGATTVHSQCCHGMWFRQ